jgi:cell division protein FtsA
MSRDKGREKPRERQRRTGSSSDAAAASYGTVAALDVGTTKIACLIGELGADGVLARVIGTGNVPARGMHKGVVVDLELASSSIHGAVEQAATQAGQPVPDAYVGIAGSHVVSMNRKVAIDNPNEDNQVTSAERKALLDRLTSGEVQPDMQLIHALPREYNLDGQDGIKRPVGMYARRIEMSGHLIFGAINSIQNLIVAVGNAGLEVDDIVLEPLASSEACLTEDERESGTILVDIGGGTTDVAMFVDDRLVHSSVLPVGGNHITKDISVGLKVPLAAAETIKLNYGHSQSHVVEDIEMAKADAGIFGESERTVTFSRKYLARIIEARITEIFNLVIAQAKDSGFLSSIAAGIVITGGTSQLEGICGVAEVIAHLPARQGVPIAPVGAVDIPGNPVYATAVGLLFYGSRQVHQRGPSQPYKPSTITQGFWNEVLDKVKGWFGQTGKT